MSSVLQKQVSIASGPVTLVTTAETLLAYSGRCEIPLPTVRSVIKGFINITTGTTVTSVVARIRRGNGVLGAQVSSATVNIGASTTDEIIIHFAEQLLNAEFADYSLTAVQTGAGTNGTANLATIEVEMING